MPAVAFVSPFHIHYAEVGGYYWISYGGMKYGPEFDSKEEAVEWAEKHNA